MKLRQKPEDFIVEEVNEIKANSSGKYQLFILEKTSLETMSLLGQIAKENKISYTDFGFAGLKDKHAITKQYITLPSDKKIKLQGNNYKFTLLGYVDEPLKIGDLQGNRFTITVRDIKKSDIEGIYYKAKTIEEAGVPNYFDSQRFGSVVGREFIIKHIIHKDYEKAVKIFLTEYTRHEQKAVKDDKRAMLANWPNFEKLRIRTWKLNRVVQEYLRTKDWRKTYSMIPLALRMLFISAYQSYLWNESVKTILRNSINKNYLYGIEYNMGSLEFYKKINEDEKSRVPKTFQTIGPKMVPKEYEKEIVEKLLSKEQLTLQEMDIKKVTRTFFKTQEREVIVYPKEFSISDSFEDELNKGYYRITVKFTLPKGSYGTVVIKRVFNA